MIVMVMSISIKINLQPYFVFIDFILMLTKLDKKVI